MSVALPAPLALAAVFAGGGVGVCCRYAVGRYVAARYAGSFPLATFAINLSGSLLLGLATGVPLLHRWGGLGLLLVGTGILGGYTTFSTAALETVLALRAGSVGGALLAWLGGAALGLAGAALGLGLAAVVWPVPA
jgi:CrcB protein